MFLHHFLLHSLIALHLTEVPLIIAAREGEKQRSQLSAVASNATCNIIVDAEQVDTSSKYVNCSVWTRPARNPIDNSEMQETVDLAEKLGKALNVHFVILLGSGKMAWMCTWPESTAG